MKTLTLYVSENIYSSYQAIAATKKVKAAALIRSAMEYYLNEQLNKKKSLENWEPLNLGRVKSDWKNSSFRDEMMDDRCDFEGKL